MELAFPLELKTLTKEGSFEGNASTYGNVDSGGDVVERGSFARTLAAGKTRKLLWAHRDPVGSVELTDSPAGLHAKGNLNLEKQSGRDAYSDLKFYKEQGSPLGLSIGFQAVEADYAGEIRHLREIKLYEVSLVIYPMNEQAVVLGVKAADIARLQNEIEEFKRGILSALKR